MDSQTHLLNTLKALADESRLTMLRLLHEREHAVGDLAARIELTEPTVSHHLARLREAGLVTLRMAGNQRFYRVNEVGLKAFKKLIDTLEQTPPAQQIEAFDESWITALGWDEEDLQVLRECTTNRRLISLPSKRKKLMIILRWLATNFEADKLYTEKEVNSVLKAAYERDYVSLRRDLVDFGYLRRERDGAKYWLGEKNS